MTPSIEIKEYIAKFPESTQTILCELHKIVHEEANEVKESLAYGMPAFKTYNKPLIYFAGYAKHIGLYATPSGHEAFEKELSNYKQGKGSVQFPLNEAIPYDLIRRIIKFRVQENEDKYGHGAK